MAIDQVDSLKKWTIVSQQISQPAAGSDWTFTIPTGQVWRILSIHGQLVTSATVASRQVLAVVKDASGNTLYLFGDSGSQAASITGHYNLLPGVAPTNPAGNSKVIGLPTPLILSEGCQILTSTASIQTGDQWSAINMLAEVGNAL